MNLQHSLYAVLGTVLVLGSLSFCKPSQDFSIEAVYDFKITGHRGYAGRYPENTLVGIQEALNLKVERIEIDVHQTKDKVIVLMHDKTIDRTTTGKGKVKHKTYEELRKYSAGSDFNKKFEAEKIPTLAEVLRFINGKAILVIEIKYGDDYYPEIEKNILKEIEKVKAKEWCIIHSFEDEILEKVHQLDASIELHKLLLTPLFYNLNKLDYVTEFSVYHRSISDGLVTKIHKMGKKINAWTVDEKSNMKELIEQKVDGVITDRPDIALTLRDEE